MQLSSLLGATVVDADGDRLGTVTDVRLKMADDRSDDPPTPEVVGLVVSPRTRASFLGYERTDLKAPIGIAALAKWWHRGTFLAAWDDVARVGSDHITLRAGYTRHSPVLRAASNPRESRPERA